MPSLSIRELTQVDADGLELELIAGEAGLDRTVEVPRVQKPGLALTGYAEQLHPGRLLTLGGTEIDYLASIDDSARTLAFETVMDSDPACLVVTRGISPPSMLIRVCRDSKVPLFVSRLTSSEFIKRITRILETYLSPATQVHGVLVDVLEVGILLLGNSAIGKSEAALDLVGRGHRLVADDVVQVRLRSDGALVGSCADTLGYHMEIRGLGIINVADLYGITAIRDHKTLHLVIELCEWEEGAGYDRIGDEESYYELLGETVPMLKLPVRPGRNLGTIIEVAARNRLLQDVGHFSARNFLATLEEKLAATGVRRSRS